MLKTHVRPAFFSWGKYGGNKVNEFLWYFDFVIVYMKYFFNFVTIFR